jgi:hypothetical protein
MSLAHLLEPKTPRDRTKAASPRKVASGQVALCGASREPAYRTMDDAGASGLAICGTCVALYRRSGKAH